MVKAIVFNGKKFTTNVRANRPSSRKRRKSHNRNITFKNNVTITAPKKGFIQFSNQQGKKVVLKNRIDTGEFSEDTSNVLFEQIKRKTKQEEDRRRKKEEDDADRLIREAE